MTTLDNHDDPLKPAAQAEICPLYREPERRGLKLYWPHAGDSRRSQVGNPSVPVPGDGLRNEHPHVDHTHIVHVSSRDVEMHYQFNGAERSGSRLVLEVPLPWKPINVDVGHEELFKYFQHTASKALATFGHDPMNLGNTLIRIALSGNKSALSTAVIQSILAFSSLHRHGVHGQAVELKIEALKTLQSASSGSKSMSGTEAAQHVAAGMLICSFEIHQASCTSGEWTWYLRGVQDIIRASGLDRQQQQQQDGGGDIAALLDWVYYHDVLARFSLRHRRKDFEKMSLGCPKVARSCMTTSPRGLSSVPMSVRSEPSHSAPPSLTFINLLSEVCDAVCSQRATNQTEEHINFLKILDWRIRTTPIPIAAPSSPSSPNSPPDDTTPLILELYQLSLLIYLNRSNPKLHHPARTQQHITRGFEIFPQLPKCDRQFPIFILGCEARSDGQRAAVLDLIDRTEQGVSSRSFNHVRILLQAVWAQDDLASGAGPGGEVGYLEKISFVISCCRILPTFI